MHILFIPKRKMWQKIQAMDLLAEHVITPDSDIPTKYVNLSKYFGVSQKFIDKYKNTASFHIIAYQEDKLF